MADRTTTKMLATRPRAGRDSFPIADGVTIASGSLVQLESGYLNHFSNSVNNSFMGVCIGGADRAGDGIIIGETSDSPDPHGFVDTSGVTLMNLASVGGTPTQAKVGDQVYSADSDTDSITLDASGTGVSFPVGWMSRFRASGDVDVQLYTPAEAKGKANTYSLNFALSLDTVTAADVITDFNIPHRFKVIDFQYVTDVAGSASDNATLTIEIGSTAVTGASLVIDDNTGTRGLVLASTSITAANVGAAGDDLTVVAGTVTDFASGSGTICITIQNLDL